MSEPIIVGVDHGYAAIKTAHFAFPSGLVAYEHEPYTLSNVLEYGGKFYVAGSGRQPLQKDKTQAEDYYLLTLAAIAKELEYLDPRCAGKILPVFGTGGKALVQVLGGPQGSRVYDPDGVACTQTAGAGGMGGKTGLYLIPPQKPFVDLCTGHPKQTDTARCLTARYGQTTLSNHRGERSGVLLIKEATKKGYKEALPGDSVDLGFAGSNTRRGRVGRDIAHTLETSCIQGIVENGGRIRRLMPRECLRLQGFEEWQIDRILAIQSDAQAYKQAGNSVTVHVIEAIARRIRAVDEELKAGTVA